MPVLSLIIKVGLMIKASQKAKGKFDGLIAKAIHPVAQAFRTLFKVSLKMAEVSLKVIKVCMNMAELGQNIVKNNLRMVEVSQEMVSAGQETRKTKLKMV